MSFSVSVVTTVVLSLTFTPIRRSLLLACSWLLRCVALESLCVADRLILMIGSPPCSGGRMFVTFTFCSKNHLNFILTQSWQTTIALMVIS